MALVPLSLKNGSREVAALQIISTYSIEILGEKKASLRRLISQK